MGSKRYSFVFRIMFVTLLWPQVQASGNHTQDSLNSFLYEYAHKNVPRFRTGELYNVSLPVNLTGMEVEIIRLRTHRLWLDGANFSSLEIPPQTLPRPFTRRVDIVYQNLGNWSASYYNVPNYTLVAPVIGFLAYDSYPISASHEPVELVINADSPVLIRFLNVSLREDDNVTMRCVEFGTNGTVQFSNVTAKSSCVTRREGHFSLVIPHQSIIIKAKNEGLKWWLRGLAAGAAGFIFLVLLGIVGYKLFKWQKVRTMERRSERSEGLDTIWIGSSRMPSASGIRTQPVLENSYIP